MKRRNYLSQFFIRIVMLWSLSFVVAAGWADGKKIGMMLPVIPSVAGGVVDGTGLSKEEQAAAQWFYDNYVSSESGKFVESSEELSDVYDVIWVMVDEYGIGIDYVKTKVRTSDLKAFFENGGNVLFTNQATQLVKETKRIDLDINVWNSTTNTVNSDIWGVQPYCGYFHQENHEIYKGMTLATIRDIPNCYELNNASTKNNRNSLWNCEDYTEFQNKYRCEILGCWEGNTFQNAGIVEFKKVLGYGKGLAIGLAAYEWAYEDGATNSYLDNIKKLTSNALAYLKVKDTESESDTVDDYTFPEGKKIGFVVLTDDIDKVREDNLDENEEYKISDDEYAAYLWFKNHYVDKSTGFEGTGVILTLKDLADVDINDFDVIWLHIDRTISEKGTSTYAGGLKSIFGEDGEKYSVKSKSYRALKNYYRNGGKLLLTSQAGQLLSKSAFGRLYYEANTDFYSGNNIIDAKVWGIKMKDESKDKVDGNYVRDYSHAIYNGLTTIKPSNTLQSSYNSDGDYNGLEIIPLMVGRGTSSEYGVGATNIEAYTENHNFIFDCPGYYPNVDLLESWENCKILGYWGHNTDYYTGPGIVEVNPTRLFAGRALTIGFGAYDWYAVSDNALYPEEFNNRYNTIDLYDESTGGLKEVTFNGQKNIQRLTANAIDYLAGLSSYEKMDFTFKKKFDGYTTMFYSDKDFVMPDRVSAYTYTVVKDKLDGENFNRTECEMIPEGYVVPKNTPVVLYTDMNALYKAEKGDDTYTRHFSLIENNGAENNTYERNTVGDAGKTNPDDIRGINSGTNILRGYASETLIDLSNSDASDKRFWILTTGHSGVGFYWATPTGFVDASNTFTCPAHKAYLVASKDIKAKDIRLPYFNDAFEDNTAIDTVIKDNTRHTLKVAIHYRV